MSFDIAGLVAELASPPAVLTITEEGRLRNKSRDYYWYSPILREQLDGVRADAVVQVSSEAEVVRVLRACHARAIPVTVRGAGTGNYGQAMPLRGGVVLDVSQMSAIRWIRHGAARAEAGVRLLDLDAAARGQTGQEQRMHPSTLRNATLGGFICGGSGGVGSITWGGLRDRGNVPGIRLVTMEAEPRAIELRGDDVQKAIHAYGTTGVVTEVEIALAPAHDWIDCIVAFDDFDAAATFAGSLAAQDALLKKLVTVLAAPIAQRYLRAFAPIIGEREHLVLAMIAPVAHEAFVAMLAASAGRLAHDGSNDGDRTTGHTLLPLYEYAWNHTTLHALKVSRGITYHQTLYPPPDAVGRALRVHRTLPSDVMDHLEFVRFDGHVACYGLPLIEFTTAARLVEIERELERLGCATFSPHAATLEEGGMKRVDPVQLAFKRETDPRGLLNPGKMLAWDDPAYTFDDRRLHLFAGAAHAAARAVRGRG